MTRALALAGFALVLSACGQEADVNPPTQPAQPITIAAGGVQATPGTLNLPGRGPASFVGRWAADVQWCAAPRDVRRPIEITPTRFEGYEHSCEIASVDELADGYVAHLACVSEGVASRERVKLAVSADTMKMTWLDRDGLTTTLHQCTTLTDTPEGAVPPALPVS